MYLPSINQSSNILDDSVTKLGWLSIHVTANYDSIGRLRQVLNELRELITLHCSVGNVLSALIVLRMHLDKMTKQHTKPKSIYCNMSLAILACCKDPEQTSRVYMALTHAVWSKNSVKGLSLGVATSNFFIIIIRQDTEPNCYQMLTFFTKINVDTFLTTFC